MLKEDGNALVLGTYQGSTYQRTIFEDVQDFDPSDKVTSELNMKLIGVMQGIDTKKYYHKRDDGKLESDQQMQARISNSLKNNMNLIDDTFQAMSLREQPKIYKF